MPKPSKKRSRTTAERYPPPSMEELTVALQQARRLLRAALPIIKPDAPLRWYKNDAVRDAIQVYLDAGIAACETCDGYGGTGTFATGEKPPIPCPDCSSRNSDPGKEPDLPPLAKAAIVLCEARDYYTWLTTPPTEEDEMEAQSRYKTLWRHLPNLDAAEKTYEKLRQDRIHER